MQFFKKTVTLKINIFALCTVLILLIGIAAAVRLHVPENLFFTLLRPSHVESVEYRVYGSQGRGYAQMPEQEVAAAIAILNQVRVTEGATRSIAPSSQAAADCKIHLKWGTTLSINAGSGIFGINTYHLPGTEEQDEAWSYLLRDLRQAEKEP